MLHFKPHVAGGIAAAVCAEMAELEQEIFPQLVASQFALLIFDPFDFGILHQLRIEPDQLHRDALDRICAGEPSRPGMDILDAALERWREPSIRPPSVVEAWLSIPGLPAAPIAPDGPARIESFPDGVSPMFNFGGEDDFARFLIDDGDPGRLRAGIYFESKVRRPDVGSLSLQDDGERRGTKHGGFAS